jgi:hypothetical protein
MKVKIEFTVDIDTDVLTQYMTELGALDESKRDFVKSTMIAGAVGTLEESLLNNGLDYNCVEVVK